MASAKSSAPTVAPEPVVEVPKGHVAVWLTGMPIDDRALFLQRASVEGLEQLSAGLEGLAREVSVFRHTEAMTHGLPTFRLVR